MTIGTEDAQLLDAALRAALDGPFFDDQEFSTLMGFTRADLRHVAGSWRQEVENESTDVVITNVLVNLVGYPHGRWDAWSEYSQTQPSSLIDLLEKWRRFRGD